MKTDKSRLMTDKQIKQFIKLGITLPNTAKTTIHDANRIVNEHIKNEKTKTN